MRCPHCGGDHPSVAHESPRVAAAVARRELKRGKPADAELWESVAKVLRMRQQLREEAAR